jgi:hypothetical protein
VNILLAEQDIEQLKGLLQQCIELAAEAGKQARHAKNGVLSAKPLLHFSAATS